MTISKMVGESPWILNGIIFFPQKLFKPLRIQSRFAIVFSTSSLSRILCIVMGLVKNTWLKQSVLKVEDMSKVKNDVRNVKYSSSGKGCGVPAVDVY